MDRLDTQHIKAYCLILNIPTPILSTVCLIIVIISFLARTDCLFLALLPPNNDVQDSRKQQATSNEGHRNDAHDADG